MSSNIAWNAASSVVSFLKRYVNVNEAAHQYSKVNIRKRWAAILIILVRSDQMLGNHQAEKLGRCFVLFLLLTDKSRMHLQISFGKGLEEVKASK